MKKSKFLKKSLAMLLAVMLVVAMIPLSAAAAPSDVFTPAADNATVTETANGWNVVFEYTTTPALRFETSGSGETVEYVNQQGVTTPVNGTVTLWEDENGDPAPLTIKVTNNGETTTHTVTWSVKDPSSTVSVKSAKIGDFDGVVNEAARTINFTVPFGTGFDVDDVAITFEGAVQTAAQKPTSTFKVDTNITKGAAGTITVQPQSNDADVTYTVTAKEETGLTAISIGDYEGEFVKNPANAATNPGYETGTINFNVPADIAAKDGKLELPISYTIGSDFTEVTLADVNDGNGITSGEKYDVVCLLSTDKVLTIKNAHGTRTYTLHFAKNDTDTTITKASANIGGKTYEGTVEGQNINFTVPANVNVANTDSVTLTGPVAVTNKAKVEGTSPVISPVEFTQVDSEYQAQLALKANTTSYRLRVTAADTKTYGYYNLTITKAEEENNNPQITSAKMVVNKDKDNEAEYTATISGTTITFNVPYSLLNTEIAGAEFTFAKTSQTALDPVDKGDLKDGGSVAVHSTDNATSRTYKIVYNRASAQTGKTISNFEVSTASNVNLKDYNNNKTFAVTASGNKFTVTLPTSVGALYPSFELSEGAKLYKVDNTADTTPEEVKGYDSKTGNASAAIDPKGDETAKTIYFVADEYLATAIANNELTGKTYDQIKNTNGTHLAEYTFDATPSDRTGKRLTAISADDGKVTGTISGTEITLNVPYSYAELGASNTAFYFDFTVDAGAVLKSNSVTLISGGEKAWANNKLNDGALTGSNPKFQIREVEDGKYALYIFNGTNYDTAATDIQVVAEDGTATPYSIKKINVADAQTGAAITSLKVNNTTASINGTKITAGLPYGTNLGQVKIDITASEMATVYEADGVTKYDPDKNYDLTSPLKFQVVSEDTKFTNVYTLTATTAAQFSDVSTDDWFYQNVMDAVAAGIVSGRGDGTFGPNDRITRRDFAIMVSKLLLDGEDAPEATTTPFSDVAANDYGLKAIAYCAENGIISGFDGEFRPGDNITRQEAASVMKNALELTGTTSDLFDDDAAIATWAKANVYACKAAGIFNGDDNNNFNPTSTLTRAEAASIMVNAMK